MLSSCFLVNNHRESSLDFDVLMEQTGTCQKVCDPSAPMPTPVEIGNLQYMYSELPLHSLI